jgi:hypothetical protein
MKAVLTAVAFVIFLLSAGSSAKALAQATPAPGVEAALTNADVARLCKLDLGDEVVIAKINQAQAVDFKLDTDSLVNLKEQGVGKEVIAAMLRRTSPPPQRLEPSTIPEIPGSPKVADSQADVRLRTKSGDIELKLRIGRRVSIDIAVNTLHYFEYPYAAAETRITEPRPILLVRLDDTPKASFAFIVKPKPDKKEDTRSVKVGKAGMLKSGSWFIPDENWTVSYDATKEEPGLWRIIPKADLKPGEYGLFVGGELYAFGVDK